MIINQQNLDFLNQGFRTTYLKAFHDAVPIAPLISMKTTSTNQEELYAWLNSVPGMREFSGEADIRHLSGSEYRISNKEYHNTIGLKETDIEDDNYGLFNNLITQMGDAAAYHPDELLLELIERGFDPKFKDYTGKAFFAENKTQNQGSAKGDKFSNLIDAELSPESFEQAYVQLTGMKNAEGRPMNLGRDICLLHGPGLAVKVNSILKAEKVDGGNTNVLQGLAKPMMWPALGQSKRWFLMECGAPVKPLIYQERKPVSFASVTDMNDSHVLRHHEYLYQEFGRYNVGFGLPQLIQGGTGGE